MLNFYVESDVRLRRLRQCPVGEHMDGFAGWLHETGYQRRPAQLSLRAAAHLGHWALACGIPTGLLDEQLDAFARHLPTCTCTHDFQGRDDYHAAGARRFVEYLQTKGILRRACAEPEPVPTPVTGFCDWMREHRGVAESMLAHYVPLVADFLAALGEDAGTYEAGAIRVFIFARASRHSCGGAKSVVNAVRMFLRFLAAYGYCSAELIAAVPPIARWKLSALPRHISA